MRMALYDRWHVHRCWPIRPPHNSLVFPHENGHLKQPVEESVVQIGPEKGSPGWNDFALGYKRFRYTRIDLDGRPHSLPIGNGKPVRF